MNGEQAVEYIHSFPKMGKKSGLDRMRKLMDRLGNPQEKLKCVHIAGTNGKGSTTAMIASCLRKAGYRTGMYISPFILDFRERMQLNGEMIPLEELGELMTRISPILKEMEEEGDCPAEFEVVTAAAFCWFYEKKCDVVCLEVGLGGRLDSTNVISSSEVSVITSISFDHVKILGDTLEKIAFEKCGILKPNGTAVSYPAQDPEALAEIMRCCQEKENQLIIGNLSSVQVQEQGLTGTKFSYAGLQLDLHLPGGYQIKNAVTALEALFVLRRKGYEISDQQIEEGISAVRFPARMEVLGRDPAVILDGAHNPSGIQALTDALREFEVGSITAVMGMLADKDCEPAVQQIASISERFIAVTPDSPRALSGEKLMEYAQPFCKNVCFENDLQKACDLALERTPKEGTILICGSLYLASDIRKILKKD